jgi:hypothetical protein
VSDVRKTVFNFSRWPEKPQGDDKIMRLIIEAGWKGEHECVEALATFIAESRLVRRAYLARVQLPKKEYFIVRQVEGEPDQTIYRSPGYVLIRDKAATWRWTTSLATARRRFRMMGCEIVSSDRGIVQSNEDFDPVTDTVAFSLAHNIPKGYEIFERRDRTFNAWYANLNGLHLRFMTRARLCYLRVA